MNATDDRAEGRRSANNTIGFTLIEIMIVTTIIALMATLAIPSFIRSRTTAQTDTCIANLRHLDSAKQQWALEQGKSSTSVPNLADFAPYIGHGTTNKLPICPNDATQSFTTSYQINDVQTPPECLAASNHILN